MEDYEAFNDVYGEYMDASFPARSAVQMADLPTDIDVKTVTIARHRCWSEDFIKFPIYQTHFRLEEM
jgi:enamine deaminase RidA (YjgF/YER057c/UK114 family)